MIVTELYNGQGLGNQLWVYFVTRIISERNGYEFGIQSTHKFKGKDFIKIDFGKSVTGGIGPEGGPPIKLPDGISNYYKEKTKIHPYSKLDISERDDDLLNIVDNTKIDGNMQSYDYIKNHRDKIIEYIEIDEDKNIRDYDKDNICVIHIRGGDFNYSSAMLDSNYYYNAIKYMREINSNMIFYVVTDDVYTSRRLLPDIEIIGSSTKNIPDFNKASHHMGGPIYIDYTILNNAKNIIMSASSFGWWAVWTNRNVKNAIAPKYWAAYKQSDGYWSCGDSIIDGWRYIDRNGVVFTYEECKNNVISYG